MGEHNEAIISYKWSLKRNLEVELKSAIERPFSHLDLDSLIPAH